MPTALSCCDPALSCFTFPWPNHRPTDQRPFILPIVNQCYVMATLVLLSVLLKELLRKGHAEIDSSDRTPSVVDDDASCCDAPSVFRGKSAIQGGQPFAVN